MASLDYLSPTFDTNDLGYRRRGNLMRGLTMFTLRDPHPNDWRQYWQINGWHREVHDASGSVLLQRDDGFEWYVTFNNLWSTGGGNYYTWKHADDRELDDGTPIERTDNYGLYLWFESDRRKPFSSDCNASWQKNFQRQGWASDGSVNFLWRPVPRLELQVNNYASFETGEMRAIRDATPLPETGADQGAAIRPGLATQQTRQYLFGNLTAKQFSSTLRGTFAFSPKLTFQAYAQLFSASLIYRDPMRVVVQPGKPLVHYSDLSSARPQDQAPDVDEGDVGLNINLILRWEWRLGSTLYLVYARQTAGSYTPSPHGFAAGFDGLDTNNGAVRGDTFLVKVDLLGAL